MIAALYARVSTTDKGQDTDLQLNELREFARKRDWESIEYVDEGISGSKVKRPNLDEMLVAARKRKVDAVVVWRMDRLGRSLSHLLQLLNEFQTLGVAFVSLRENIDMTTATGRLMAHMIGAFAEFERELIRERVKAGIATARRKGKRIGRKPVPPIVLQQMIKLHLEGLAIRKIAERTKSSIGSVHRTIDSYRAGAIDCDGLKTAPLFPELFSCDASG